MTDLNQAIVNQVMSGGPCAVGFATVETLEGGPPSADLTYVLPEAKSAVSFALPLDQSVIPPYLSKKDRSSFEQDKIRTNLLSNGIALSLARFLETKGYPSYPVASNFVFRKDVPASETPFPNIVPEISHRYLAVRSGVAQFGLSGNLLRKKEGAGIVLGSVVTTAELEPTDPLPDEENYCDDCRLCVAACASSFMDPDEAQGVTLGGIEFTHSKRRTYMRCGLVCGGFTGLHPSGKWSTWSPGRFPLPDNDEELPPILVQAVTAFNGRPDMEGGYYNPLADKQRNLTCSNCQLVCSPDKEERKRRYKMLIKSGCVVQNPDGSLEALPPEEAAKRVAAMSPETRALYEGS